MNKETVTSFSGITSAARKREEYLNICREIFDFIIRSAERYRKDHGGESFSEILRERTLLSFLFRHGWRECSCFPDEVQQFLAEADIDFFRAADKYRELIPEIASRNVAEAFSWNCEYEPGMSLRWSEPHPDLPPNWCIFHMWNGKMPDSFLNDKRYLAECFLKIMHDSRKKYPQYDTLYTFSWLLSHPRFQAFFPEEWFKNMGEKYQEIHWDLGFQGQFLTARMTLNRKTAAQYLETGVLPYQPRASHCSFSAMEKHLRKQFLREA